MYVNVWKGRNNTPYDIDSSRLVTIHVALPCALKYSCIVKLWSSIFRNYNQMHPHSSPTHLTPGLLLAEVPRIVLKPDGWGQHSPYGRLLFDFQVSSFKKYSEAELQMLRSEVRGLSIDLHPRIFPFSSLQTFRKRPRKQPSDQWRSTWRRRTVVPSTR